LAAAARWVARRSPPLSDLESQQTPLTLRDAISRNLDGSPVAAATVRRKRSAVLSALLHAIGSGLLTRNVMAEARMTRSPALGAVDRRVGVNPEQARALLAAVRGIDPALEAFFACLYFAALRPARVPQFVGT